MAELKQSTARVRVFKMIDSADHFSKKTGLTCTVNISKNGGAFGAAAGSVAEIANGWYSVSLTTTDTNTLGDLAYYITAAGADDTDFCDQVTAQILGDTLTANTTQLGGQTVTAGAGVTFPSSVASPTNITAATGVDITKILGTAISAPATAGILDVNIKNINNVVAATPGAANGLLISGSNSGTTTLGALTVTGNMLLSAGLTINQSTGNASALAITGNGTGHGALITSGSGATGDGLKVVAASTNGNGLNLVGVGTGSGALTTGGVTGHGLKGIGGATSGDGLNLSAVGANSCGINAAGTGSGHGIKAAGGTGVGSGIHVLGASNGDGLSCQGNGDGGGITAHGGLGGTGLGPGFYAACDGTGAHAQFGTSTTGGNALYLVGGPNSDAFTCQGTGTGVGMRTKGGATNGGGWLCEGQGSGIGLFAYSGTGSGAQFSSLGGNGAGVRFVGNGSGPGLSAEGGATGTGLAATAGATSGNGISALGAGTADGIYAQGGATSGYGVGAFGGAPNGGGLYAYGQGSGPGLDVGGGTTGTGLKIVGGPTSGAGLSVTTTAGDGISVTPTAGNALTLTGNGTSKHGMVATGSALGTGDGIKGVAGAGGVPIRGDLTANITGNLSGSVGSVTGAVGSVTGNVGGNVVGSVGSVTAAVAITSNIKQNQALANFEFLMTDSTGHAPSTGLAVTVTRSIDGGAFAAGTLSAVTEVGSGLYRVDFGAGDLNGKVIVLKATAAASDTTFERIITQV